MWRNCLRDLWIWPEIDVMTEDVLPQAMRISDGIWVIDSNEDIELTKVSEKQRKSLKRLRSPLTVITFAVSCVLFRTTQASLPSYQAEEKFQIRDNFLSFTDVSTNNWTGAGSQLVKEFLKLESQEFPTLLESTKKISLKGRAEKLRRINGTKIPRELKVKCTLRWYYLIPVRLVKMITSIIFRWFYESWRDYINVWGKWVAEP